MIPTRRKQLLAASGVTSATIALVAAAIGLFGLPSRADSDSSERLERLLQTCVGQRDRGACFDRQFASAAARGDIAEALGALETLVEHGVLDDCHLEAHSLAHAAFAAFRDFERAFFEGRNQCRTGYLHGVVEAAVAGVGSRQGALHSPTGLVCSRLRLDRLRSPCAHGLGHALMYRARFDVAAAVRGCRRLRASGLPERPCQLGVMMQNSMRYSGLSPERFRMRAPQACNGLALTGELFEMCYANLGLVAAFFFGHDRARTFNLCAEVRGDTARQACLRGARDELRESEREQG